MNVSKNEAEHLIFLLLNPPVIYHALTRPPPHPSRRSSLFHFISHKKKPDAVVDSASVVLPTSIVNPNAKFDVFQSHQPQQQQVGKKGLSRVILGKSLKATFATLVLY